LSAFAITGATVFGGAHMLDGRAVVVENGRISRVPKVEKLNPRIERREVEGLLAPGFIDVQVNGGGGVLFNDERSLGGIRAIGAAHRRFGTTGFLPTFITDTRGKMAEAVAAVNEALAAGVPGVLGIHLEGPFLNPERKGVHDPKLMRPIEAEDIRIMTSLKRGVTLVTLAPEKVPIEAIEALASGGAIIAAGHTAASYALLKEARAHGVRGYTHLFNAMPPLQSREPGPVGAALDERETWSSIIADMHHVSAPALRIALAAKGVDRTVLVTDAMSTVGSELQTFDLQGRAIFRRDGRLTTEDGTLAGSDLDMATAVRNTAAHLGVDLAEALRMASLVPATFLHLDGELGLIKRGYRANMVLLGEDLRVRRTWIDGEEEGD
jgi:N-acetylglucosamine-6-phosphate deacetylase